MGFSDLGPFDNDSALDFIDEFLDAESPAGSIRSALTALASKGYHDVDVVSHAWAACELVAMAASEGTGYDPDDIPYEAAARLRPNKKLIATCLEALPRILDQQSELAELLGAKQRPVVEQHLDSARQRLEHGLTLTKFARLKVPKVRALQAYALPAGDRWMIALSDHSHYFVLDSLYDSQPASIEEIDPDTAAILFVCHYARPTDELVSLGRYRPTGRLAEPYEFVTLSRWGCLSGSDMGSFENAYMRIRGSKFESASYDGVRDLPYCALLQSADMDVLLESWATTGAVDPPAVPTPDEVREDFIRGCEKDWAPYLAGEGGGPFSFPKLYQHDVRHYVVPWIKIHMSIDWSNGGLCLPDDLAKYFIAGLVGVAVGVYPLAQVPERLAPLIAPLGQHVSERNVRGAVHVLGCILDEDSIIPRVLAADPPRRAAFFDEASRLRERLLAALDD